MRIEDKRKQKSETPFGKLFISDTFEYDECLWIKCGDDMALNLNDGVIDEFGSRVDVIKVNTIITIID